MAAPSTPVKSEAQAFFRARQPEAVHISPLLVPQEDILFEALSDLDSDDTRTTKRQRREDAARIYLKTGIPNITTARLRGPFPSTWKNPWAKETRKQSKKTPRKQILAKEKKTPRSTGQELGNGSASRPKRTPIKLPAGLDHLDPHDKAQYARLKRPEENLQSQLQDHHARLESFGSQDDGVEEITELMDAVKRSLARIRASLLKYRPARAQTRLLTDGVQEPILDVSPQPKINEKRKLEKQNGAQSLHTNTRGYVANTPLRRAPTPERKKETSRLERVAIPVDPPQNGSGELLKVSENDTQLQGSHPGVEQTRQIIVPASTDKEPVSIPRLHGITTNSSVSSATPRLRDLSIIKNSFGVPSSADISPLIAKPPLLETSNVGQSAIDQAVISGITPSTSNDAGVSNLGRSPWLPEGQQLPITPDVFTNDTNGSLSQIVETSLPDRPVENNEIDAEERTPIANSVPQAEALHNPAPIVEGQIDVSNASDSHTSKERFVTPDLGVTASSGSQVAHNPDIEPQPSLPKFTIESEPTQEHTQARPQEQPFRQLPTFLSAEDIDTSPDFTTLLANLGQSSAPQDAQKIPMPSFPDFLGSGLTTLSSSELDLAMMDVEDILKGGTWSAEKEVDKLSR